MVFVRSSFYKVIVLESGLHVLLYLCYFDSQFPLGCGIQRGDERSPLFFEIPAGCWNSPSGGHGTLSLSAVLCVYMAKDRYMTTVMIFDFKCL